MYEREREINWKKNQHNYYPYNTENKWTEKNRKKNKIWCEWKKEMNWKEKVMNLERGREREREYGRRWMALVPIKIELF